MDRIFGRVRTGLLGACCVLFVSLAAAESRTCATASLDAPVRLPDGSLHQANTLTLCVGESFSPVSTLHRTYLNRRPVGLLASRPGIAEGGEMAEPFMMFVREPGGVLRLYGYALPSGGEVVTYLLQDVRSRKKKARGGLPPDVAAGAASTPTLLAARLSP